MDAKQVIETGVDKLVELLKSKGRMSFQDAAKELAWLKNQVEYWEKLEGDLRDLEELATPSQSPPIPSLSLGAGGEAGNFSPSRREGGDEEGVRLKLIPYQQISLDKPWQEYDIAHDMTSSGLAKFAADWNALIN